MPPNPTTDPARAQLARLADRSDAPLPEVFRRVCEAAAEVLRVERAGVWLFVNGDRTLRCVSLFERSKQRHSKGGCLLLADFPAFRRAIATAPLLPCESARSDPRTAELNDSYLAPHGIASVLDAPLLRDGRVVGLVCHEHVGPPRGWTDDDRTFALAIAELVAERMKAAEGTLRTTPQQPPGPARPAERGDAHDLRNVLAEILAHAELLSMTAQLPPAATARIAGITAAAERGVALIRRLFESPPADPGTGEHESLPPRSDRAEPPQATDDGTDEHEALPPDATG